FRPARPRIGRRRSRDQKRGAVRNRLNPRGFGPDAFDSAAPFLHDQGGTMRVHEWWHGAVIYEVYLPSFSDSNGDGWGDLHGLLQRLEHISSLGVDAVWLTPFYPSPMEDMGYDIAAFCDVDPRFGKLADFDAVVARAHALGLRVIIDQVWAHTAATHPWFQESTSGDSSAKADWYVWADARPDGSPPNNWLSVFGGSAWQWHPVRRQYYLHHFLPSQPKLDLRNEEVLNAHFSNAEFWLARGVDGFRLDAIDFMLHDGMLRDNPPNPNRAEPSPWNPFRFQRHLYDMCQPANQELVTDLRRFIDRFPEVVTLGELSSEAGALGRVAALTGRSKLHMAYTLGVMKTAFSPTILREAIADGDAGDAARQRVPLSGRRAGLAASAATGLGDPRSLRSDILPGLCGSRRGAHADALDRRSGEFGIFDGAAMAPDR